MRERLRLNFNFRFRNELHHQEFLLLLNFYNPKESNLSSFYIPSYIGALKHMMHVRVQKKNVRHLALMCYMWYMVIMSFILVLMYENLYANYNDRNINPTKCYSLVVSPLILN